MSCRLSIILYIFFFSCHTVAISDELCVFVAMLANLILAYRNPACTTSTTRGDLLVPIRSSEFRQPKSVTRFDKYLAGNLSFIVRPREISCPSAIVLNCHIIKYIYLPQQLQVVTTARIAFNKIHVQ